MQLPATSFKKQSAIPISLSNRFLLHLKFHSHPILACFPISCIVLFCWHKITYNLGYFARNDVSLWFHLSSQNLIFSPFLAFHAIPPCSAVSYWGLWRANLRSSHHKDTLLSLVTASRPLHPPYFDSRILAHSSPLWWNKFHFHLASNARLNLVISFIPKPPLSLGRHTVYILQNVTNKEKMCLNIDTKWNFIN